MKKVSFLIGALIVSCFVVYGHYKNCVEYEKNRWCNYSARSYCPGYSGSMGYKNCVKYEKNLWCNYKARGYCTDICRKQTEPIRCRSVEPSLLKTFPFMQVSKDDTQSKYYWSPLFWAVALEDTAEIKRLLQELEQRFGHDKKKMLEELNKQDWAGRTAFYLSVEWICRDTVALFLSLAARWFAQEPELFYEFVTKQENLLRWSPLHSALYASFSPAVHGLIQTAQHVLGKESVLFEKFINLKDAFGRTPLAVGVEPWDRIFVYNHGGIEIQSEELAKPKHKKLREALLKSSSLMGHLQELTKVLKEGTLEAHYIPSQATAKKFSSVLQKAEFTYIDEKKSFLDFITARNGAGWTALMNATADGNSEYVELILSAANNFFSDDKVWVAFIMNTCDIHGRTVWHLAISRHHIDIIKTLIRVQKEIAGNRKKPFLRIMTHRTELNGFTPLHVAVYESADDNITFKIIKLLLERADEVLGVGSREFNAFINMRDYDGFSALDYATTPRIHALLKKYGAR